MSEKTEKDTIVEQKLVLLSAQISPDLKKTIKAFGGQTKRTLSASVFFLLETHPDILNFQKKQEQPIEVTA